MKKTINILFLIFLIVLSIVISLLPCFATSISATIILYDVDMNEVATFHTVVDDQDEIPWWVQYNDVAYAYEYGTGNTYGYIADGGDFSGYWYEGEYFGDIVDLPFPPGYQPPEPDPDLIQIHFIGYRASEGQSITLYTSVIYGEPGDTYSFTPLNIPGFRPQYNVYTGSFGSVDSEVNILYVADGSSGISKQVQLNYIVYDNNSYRTLYSAVINVDRSYSNFDTRTVYEHSKYYNASPYIDIDYDSTNLTFDIYLVNIKDTNAYLQPMLDAEYDRIYDTAYDYGDEQGYYRGVNDENPATLANFLPNVFGSVITSFYYIVSNMNLGGLALTSIIALIITIAIVILIIKVARG